MQLASASDEARKLRDLHDSQTILVLARALSSVEHIQAAVPLILAVVSR